MARGDVSLQQRAGSNNAERPSPFGISEARYESLVRKVLASPHVLLERGLDEDPVILSFALPLVVGYAINRTPTPLTLVLFAEDAQGRRLQVGGGVVPAGTEVPLFAGPFSVPAAWILAPGEKLVLEVVAGDPLAGNGLWVWPQKQFPSSRVQTPRIIMGTSDVVVMSPPPGRVFYPSAFQFNGDFRALYLINYSPTTPSSASSFIDAEEGSIAADVGLVLPPATATPVLAAFGAGWGLSHPNKVRVRVTAIPTDGDIVFAASYLLMDEP